MSLTVAAHQGPPGPPHQPKHPWLAGARPRTLPAAVVPVLLGTAVAIAAGHTVWWRAADAMVVSLAIQVGTNYANDYSDGVRGTDTVRVGPLRLVAGGLASPAAVKRAAIAAFGLAGLAGLALAITVSPWLIALGAACIAAGWLYTGGPRPYGYAGLGELFVFVFFGPVATVGTAYVQLGRITGLALVASIPAGLLPTALLVVNNLRDVATDTVAGKTTLAVRLGRPATRLVYTGCLAASFGGAVAVGLAYRPWALLALAALPLGVIPARQVLGGADGRALIESLGATGRLQLALGVLLAAGIAI
ncbi:MAG: 1,4-dihydroxy-2-naphthoate polyprenyltransferase [Acidimicrobiales bacterium]